MCIRDRVRSYRTGLAHDSPPCACRESSPGSPASSLVSRWASLTRLNLSTMRFLKVWGSSSIARLPKPMIQAARASASAYFASNLTPVSYTHLRAHETVLDLVCRLLLEKKKKKKSSLTILNY